MIYLGCVDDDKRGIIRSYVEDYHIERTIVISADAFPLSIPGTDQVRYSDVIMYVTFYRLLQEITPKTLIVLNECLRTQNRYDLAYNCIRNYLNLTTHQLIFQQFPQIDTAEDFMVLFDWDTRSRWKRRSFDPYLVKQETQVQVHPLLVEFQRIDVPTSARTREHYDVERERLFREIGSHDPHAIPRNLYMIGGPDKLAYVRAPGHPLLGAEMFYVARNKRLGMGRITTYADACPGRQHALVELPHRFLDFIDFIYRVGQTAFPVLVADLKVDSWYLSRYQEWARRLHDTYANLL
jgi:hypothetical protein